MSREQAKSGARERFRLLADEGERRFDELLLAVSTADRYVELNRKTINDILAIQAESNIYDRARAAGRTHGEALEMSREGRRLVDALW